MRRLTLLLFLLLFVTASLNPFRFYSPPFLPLLIIVLVSASLNSFRFYSLPFFPLPFIFPASYSLASFRLYYQPFFLLLFTFFLELPSLSLGRCQSLTTPWFPLTLTAL